MVVHSFNPSPRETEAGRPVSSRPNWSTYQVPGQPGMHSETLSLNDKTTKADTT